MTRVLRYLLRKFYLLLAITLISLAVVVQAGRSLSPLLSDYREPIAQYLSEQLNAQVTLGSIHGEWEGLMPIWEVADLQILSQANEPILAFQSAQLRLDLLSSLWNWRLVLSTVSLQATALEFVQTPAGFWRISGLLPGGQTTPEAAQVDLLVDMLLLANKIEFQNTHLLFHFDNGHQIALDSPSLLLENQEQFHRISLAVDIEARKQAVNLVIEGVGDPRNVSDFHVSGYLALNDFPTYEPLAAASALLLGDMASGELRSEGALNAQLWFNSRPAKDGFDISGQLSLQTLLLPLLEQQYRLDRFSTMMSGHWLHTGAWNMNLIDLNAGLQDAAIENVNLAISSRGDQQPLEIQLDQLQVTNWVKVLDQAGVIGTGHLREVIQSLAPQGKLTNLLVTLPLDKPQAWQLEAVADQLAVNAWHGVPAFTGVDGYLKAGQKGGFINLDSRQGFSMLFERTYSEAMRYQSVSGQVAWHLQPENNQIYVNSGALHLHNDTEDATGYMWLAMPWKHDTGDIDLYLHIGARNLAASLYPKYLPVLVPESLSAWLEKSIGTTNSGAVNEAGFLYRGTLNTHEHMARSHQLYLDVTNAELAYHPDWPALTELRGRLLINDNDVDASVASGKIYNSNLHSVRVATRPNSAGEGALLTVTGQVQGLASDGLRVLREGYLRQFIGHHMDSWALTGTMTANIDIAVPLEADAGGATQQIDVELNAPSFSLDEYQLALADVQGKIHYSHSTGIVSEGLQGKLFNEPITAKLASQLEPAKTLIVLDGAVAAEDLAVWSKRPELFFLKGKLPYHTEIELLHQAQTTPATRAQAASTQTRSAPATSTPADLFNNPLLATVTVASDLNHVAVDLPAPFGKQAKGKRALTMTLEIHTQTMGIALDYSNKTQTFAQAELLVARRDNELLNANVALGSEAYLPSEPQFKLSGFLPSLDINTWQEVLQKYQASNARLPSPPVAEAELSELQEPAQGYLAGLPLTAEITLGKQELGPLLLKDLQLQAWHEADTWHLSFANPILLGSLQLPANKTQPMLVAIDELHLNRALLGDPDSVPVLPELELSAELTAAADKFHPASLPRADVRVQALYVDGNNYGNWSLQVHPQTAGVLVDQIRGNLRGLEIGGLLAHQRDNKLVVSDVGAKIYWLTDEQGTHSRFVGSLTTGDMADVLAAWQKPDMIDSTSASYLVDLNWPGAPGEFALLNVEGDIDLLLQDGRFRRTSASGSEGILRLFALLNFDSLARRLRLDFSDLYKSGLSYDEVQGKIHFDAGKIYFTEPILVQGPSSRLQMAGSVNLHDETIDARLIAALPVAGNLTFLAAFAAGLPAAAGIYLISKIFHKQVDQATSMSYSIQGSWDDPVMKFDRLFESEQSLRNSVSKQELDIAPAELTEPVTLPEPVELPEPVDAAEPAVHKQ